MKRTDSDGVSMYFWPRNDKSVPKEVRSNTGSISPSSSWGKPEGVWPTSQCDFASHFTDHNIIINLTFCVSFNFTISNPGNNVCFSL